MSVFRKILLGACVFMCAWPAFAAEKRVYKVDSVIATAKRGILLIQAKGAVETGGWKNSRLHVVHNGGHSVTVEFVATPPPPGMTVIEALVPVTATTKLRTHGSIDSVRTLADANEMTTQVLR